MSSALYRVLVLVSSSLPFDDFKLVKIQVDTIVGKALRFQKMAEVRALPLRPNIWVDKSQP